MTDSVVCLIEKLLDCCQIMDKMVENGLNDDDLQQYAQYMVEVVDAVDRVVRLSDMRKMNDLGAKILFEHNDLNDFISATQSTAMALDKKMVVFCKSDMTMTRGRIMAAALLEGGAAYILSCARLHNQLLSSLLHCDVTYTDLKTQHPDIVEVLLRRYEITPDMFNNRSVDGEGAAAEVFQTVPTVAGDKSLQEALDKEQRTRKARDAMYRPMV